MADWFNQEAAMVLRYFSSDCRHGLATPEIAARLAQFGENSLKSGPKISPWQIFISQFLDFMVLVLVGAAVVSGLLGERADAVTIIAIVVLNAILGFIQEYRAEKSLAALKELTAPQAKALRDSQVQKVPVKSLVPGDILVLECGDRIPADGRIIESVNLEANEAALTGESQATPKTECRLNEKRPALGDQRNMVFAGTLVSSGRGKAVVTATGMKTEIGKIAGMISSVTEEDTPLQKKLAQLGRWLIVLCLGVCAAVGVMGICRGEPPRRMFLAAISLAVAAIPEGLPAIVTIALAMGVRKMIKRKAIIRRLPAVETLGCATVICSDKTGTLTRNKLAVTRIWDGTAEYKADDPAGDRVEIPTDLRRLLEIGALCNNARLSNSSVKGEPEISGDPTEGALLLAAAKFGLNPQTLANARLRLGEVPFSSERKMMSVRVNNKLNKEELLVKGAADVLIDKCSQIRLNGIVRPMTSQHRRKIINFAEEWGAEALRVLAFAYRELPSAGIGFRENRLPEDGLIFAGLMGMTDPPRPETKSAVARSRRAGIQVKMITGDYARTAAAVGKQIGLLRPGGKIITGSELDLLSDEQLAGLIGEIDIFARVSPHHKLRVVKALKKNRAVVAMTGDGVNDAPAVKEADIGVAMGMSGTDVTKEAAAMVIADDNFASIIAAVEEGRVIYDNIRKFIRYLLSCNMGEILTMFGGILLGLPLPLLPIQLLWVNLVTDGLPAIALGMDPAASGIMDRPPRDPREGIFSRNLGGKIIFQGFLIGLGTLAVYLIKLAGGDLLTARTAAFNTLVFAQLIFVFRCRSEAPGMTGLKLTGNPYLLGAVLLSTVMQLLVVYLSPLQKIFYVTRLFSSDWLIIGVIIFLSIYLNDFLFQILNIFRKQTPVFRLKTHRVDG